MPIDIARGCGARRIVARALLAAQLAPLMARADALFDPRLFDRALWRLAGRFAAGWLVVRGGEASE
jgi:hypothetical protein